MRRITVLRVLKVYESSQSEEDRIRAKLLEIMILDKIKELRKQK